MFRVLRCCGYRMFGLPGVRTILGLKAYKVIRLYGVIQGYTRLYKYKAIQGYTVLYRVIQCYTGLSEYRVLRVLNCRAFGLEGCRFSGLRSCPIRLLILKPNKYLQP